MNIRDHLRFHFGSFPNASHTCLYTEWFIQELKARDVEMKRNEIALGYFHEQYCQIEALKTILRGAAGMLIPDDQRDMLNALQPVEFNDVCTVCWLLCILVGVLCVLLVWLFVCFADMLAPLSVETVLCFRFFPPYVSATGQSERLFGMLLIAFPIVVVVVVVTSF